jgi:hypothetical protein
MILEYNFGQKRAKATSKNLRSLLKFRPPDIANDNEEEWDNPDNDELSDDESSESSDDGNDELQSNAINSYDSTHESAQPVFSHVALFTPTVCDQFDSDAKEYGRILQKQSSRYWKRSFFYHGITSNSRKVGHEERNCLLLCLLIYTSSRYERYSSLLDPELSKRRKVNNDAHQKTRRLDYLIELLSESLLLEQFMLSRCIPKSTLVRAQKYIPLYLSFLKDVCPRQSGMGWKLTKFHILLHLISDIQRLSIPLNFDSNVVESHHKEEKKGGNRTQMRASKIDKQTATRRTEQMLIDRAYNDLYPPGSLFDEDEDDSTTLPNHNDNSLSSLKMVFLPKQGLFFTNSRGHPSHTVNQLPGPPYLLSQINDFFESFFSNTNLPVNVAGIYT